MAGDRPGTAWRRTLPRLSHAGRPARRHSPGRPARRRLSQELVTSQTGVPQPALGVQDAKLGGSARRPVTVPRDAHLHPLADHVPTQPDPGPPAQLQAERGDLGQGARHRDRQPRRLEDDQLDARLAGQRRQAMQSFAQRCRRQPSPPGPRRQPSPPGPRRQPSPRSASHRQVRRQIQQQQVHHPVLEEQRRHGQRLLDGIRDQDDQPAQRDAPRRRLDWIQAMGQIQVGRDAASRLGLGDSAQGQRRLAAAGLAPQDRGRIARQPAQPENGVQRPEARRYGPPVHRPFDDSTVLRDGRHGQRAQYLSAPTGSCPAPAFPEGRESGLDSWGWLDHGASILERKF
jgi:hypothetical protein